MDTEQISSYIMRYLDAMSCNIMEKTPAYVTVKLSEQADRLLTNRPYYWGFIDRTGTEAETMRYTFVFDPANMPADPFRAPVSYVTAPSIPSNPAAAGDAAIQHTFGVAPGFNGGSRGPDRIPRENVDFGSRRLAQIMDVAKESGRFVSLYESLDSGSEILFARGRHSVAYEPWIMLNVKLEFACDLKREEVHSIGFSLISGTLHMNFMDKVMQCSLTPKLPAQVHTMTWRYTLEQAVQHIEQTLTEHVRSSDETWAVEASERLEDEWDRLAAYYEPLLKEEAEMKAKKAIASEESETEQDSQTVILTIEVDEAADEPEQAVADKEPNQLTLQEQYDMRRNEIEWQFQPRIEMSIINAAIIYLRSNKIMT
ncbi:YqhG family protein [Paenibacillus sp. SC116]|uniref:YqhG family protein n=1 Tax=Paenibacillus sp. SC116 TaxID=2968986 RepID=UPI00215B65BF|nr:YqhG family protein [Paenibacillus sp. SC116]MCR8843345.1 YqhG family protein [Paenibacillus sp. SC116]